MPRNLTLAIDEDLLQKARVLAAMNRTTVNAMVREFLEHAVGEVSKESRRADWDALFRSIDAQATDRRTRMTGGPPSRRDLDDEDGRGGGVL